jgi:S1-C subfamily serine protease
MIGGAIVIAAIGALIGRGTAPTAGTEPQQSRRPIVQIVRSQGPLPSLADTIDKLCPSIATIVPRGTPLDAIKASQAKAGSRKSKSPAKITQAAAFSISADGWLVTSSKLPDGANFDAVFGDGTRARLTEVRIDPVSGMAVAKADAANLTPLTLDDQAFARVGDFGFALQTSGTGCSAGVSMVGGDFLTDSTGRLTYVRLQPGAPDIVPGEPFMAGDGRIIGISTRMSDEPGTLIPAPVAATIIDELIRGSASPTTDFGFRATDFTQGLSARVGDTRSRGAGVSLVKPKSPADKAGLEAGDVIVAVDGSPVSSASELGRNLDAVKKTGKLDILRGEQRKTLKITRNAG